jgi:hypothetical protein
VSFEPGALFLNLVISLVGTALFVYGKKAQRWPQMTAGLSLAVYPYFVPEYWMMVLVGVVILGALWIAVRMGY